MLSGCDNHYTTETVVSCGENLYPNSLYCHSQPTVNRSFRRAADQFTKNSVDADEMPNNAAFHMGSSLFVKDSSS